VSAAAIPLIAHTSNAEVQRSRVLPRSRRWRFAPRPRTGRDVGPWRRPSHQLPGSEPHQPRLGLLDNAAHVCTVASLFMTWPFLAKPTCPDLSLHNHIRV